MRKVKINCKRIIRWLVEIVIWFLIFVSVASLITYVRATYKSKFQTYQIFLPDVDGLIVGSPVRMMGVQIGYVKQVNIVEDEVYLKFFVNQKDIIIPKGSVVTVEFTGLGGSKSLEVYPQANMTNEDEYIIVHPPRRLHDSAGLFYDMYEKISDISYKISYFVKQTTDIKIPKDISNKNLKKILKNTDNWLENTTEKIEK